MTEQRPLNTSPLPLKLRVEDFLLLDRAGVFVGYAKTELIDGEIFFMNAQHRPHARIKTELAFRIRLLLDQRSGSPAVLIEPTIAMPPHDAPEPDIVLTREPEGEGPVPLASVAMVVEVADASLAFDTGKKQALYARHGIPEYWIVDVNARVIRQLWAAESGQYQRQEEIAFGNVVRSQSVPGLEVPTNSL